MNAPDTQRRPAAVRRLGAVWHGDLTEFSVVSATATVVYLCLFDEQHRETARIPMVRASAEETTESGQASPFEIPAGTIWSRKVRGIAPGQLYGFRVERPSSDQGNGDLTMSPLLFDPSARDYDAPDSERRFGKLRVSSEPPIARVVHSPFDWEDDRPPARQWRETVLYELHVRGMTALHPEIDPRLRGTYLGLVEPCVLDHLRTLGVTAVELMPIFFSRTEPRLQRLGLTNYWGYNTLGFFAADRRFCATADPVREVKTMVKRFHEAGIEVILDVVYNHTAEGGADGPVFNFKELDNAAYYWLDPKQSDPQRPDPADHSAYVNYTGCGNTLDPRSTVVRRLIFDSLRYWAEEIRVDGFRFDLATTLGRTGDGFSPTSPLFEGLRNDPILSHKKLIAEPWDLGPGGYRLGHFPAPWREWNDRYRDTARSFWRGDEGAVPRLATRLAGSSDVFPGFPSRSINFVTCHDGFTLADLVSYEARKNTENGESNRDGHHHNLSRNWGWEGETDDPAIRSRRSQIRRNFIATLALSRGVPMLSHGDELGRTQQGNNNAYCHDSPTTWVRWSPPGKDRDHREFWSRTFALRRRVYPLIEELSTTSRWIRQDGRLLTREDWQESRIRAFGWWLETLLVLFNGGSETVRFRLPDQGRSHWEVVLDTQTPSGNPLEDGHLQSGDVMLAPHSLRVLISDPRLRLAEDEGLVREETV